jgi:hypothetical protein
LAALEDETVELDLSKSKVVVTCSTTSADYTKEKKLDIEHFKRFNKISFWD